MGGLRFIRERGGTYQTRPKAPIPTGCSSVYLKNDQLPFSNRSIDLLFRKICAKAYRLVISKVVPKIVARTNSAILEDREAALFFLSVGFYFIFFLGC